jgi:CTP:molybdopterin cytidylyltransferase MocA
VDRTLAPEMDRISGDRGFRALFAEHAADILEVAVDDPGILFDVDTPEQVESLETRLAHGIPLHQALTELVTAGPTRTK